MRNRTRKHTVTSDGQQGESPRIIPAPDTAKPDLADRLSEASGESRVGGLNSEPDLADRLSEASGESRVGGLNSEPDLADRLSEASGESRVGGLNSEPGDRQEIETAGTFPAYLQAMIENSSDAILALNQDFHVLHLNPAASLALNKLPEEMVGSLCQDSLRCQNLNRVALCGTSSCPLVRVLQKKLPLPNEELIIGTELEHSCEVSVCVTPVSLEGKSYAVFSARDMSTLKVANRVRANFVSMVSHELRTPLNSVHGFIDLLVQGHMGALTEEQRTYLVYAQEGVQQLVSIVEDILFMTRSDLGQFTMKQEEVHLDTLVRQVLGSLRPQAHKAGVVLCRDIPPDIPSLYVDPQRIKQVLNNLLTNAIKFTPPGGTVTMSCTRYDEDFVMVSVADTGYGILPEDRPHIFERFYQSNHSQQSKMGGYGLGLSIAKLIIEQHGGAINFDSTVNKGSTFYFLLPRFKSHPQ